jgi:hypothetical protein
MTCGDNSHLAEALKNVEHEELNLYTGENSLKYKDRLDLCNSGMVRDPSGKGIT